MQTITEYKTVSMRITDAFEIVDSTGKQDLRNLRQEKKLDYVINTYIKEGWQPFGLPYLVLDQRWQQINQTMVKYANPFEQRNWGEHKTSDNIKKDPRFDILKE